MLAGGLDAPSLLPGRPVLGLGPGSPNKVGQIIQKRGGQNLLGVVVVAEAKIAHGRRVDLRHVGLLVRQTLAGTKGRKDQKKSWGSNNNTNI